ncbi:hypothetical protein Tsubulata_021747 [Turnera subulata]|uniref:DUF1664 domain-containing protein n=1 Tax=Turnera subulata TaxID=218843 RepID=A0A9Q0FGB2_9ROSI|nr:hypothetical protein Tsubulata_021747 [Turnera subulata]
MALPLGKLTIIVGAGLIGSVIAKEGRLSDVTGFFSSAAKIAFKQLKRDDSTPAGSKPRSDSLLAQVNSIQQELRLLASNRPVTIVTSSGSGSSKYGVIILVVVVGYGYVWWKGWKLPDMMFATRRSLSDACNSIGEQLENVYASLRSTKRHLSSKIDTVDSNLTAVAEMTASTHAKVTELRDDSEKIGQDVRYVRDAVETLELKISRIEGKQASTSSSHIAYSSKVGALPPPSSEPSSPIASHGSAHVFNSSREALRPPRNPASVSGQQRIIGVSGMVDVPSSLLSSEDNRNGEETSNGSSWFRAPFFTRTLGGTVLQRTGSR